MPGSKINGKERIKEFVHKQTDITTILDIGPGSGTYARLLGDKYTYIGVEIFEHYVEQFRLKHLYHTLIIGDASEIELPPADLIIFGDVLEHMKKEKAEKLLAKAINDYKHIVVSIPINEGGSIVHADIHYGNEHEAHISGWTFKELESYTKWSEKITSGGLGIFLK
jgi:SAM-dependent methyltransferase